MFEEYKKWYREVKISRVKQTEAVLGLLYTASILLLAWALIVMLSVFR